MGLDLIGDRNKFFLIFVFACGASIVILPYASSFPSLIVEDDGFFYAKIAQNIASLGISTFDGLNETSGYHLLWMGILSIVAWLGSWVYNAQEFALFCFLVASFSVIFIYSAMFFQQGESRLLAIVLSLICSLLTEVNILVLFLLIFYSWFLKDSSSEAKAVPWSVLIAVAAIPLTRIDSLVMIILPLVYLFLKNRKVAIALSIAVVLGVSLQLLIMWAAFDNFFSVSSMLKTSELSSHFESNFLRRGFDYTVRNIIAISFLMTAILLGIYRKNWRILAISLSVSWFYCAHLFLSDQRHWYFLPIYLPMLFCILNQVTNMPRFKTILSHASILASVVLMLAFGLAYQLMRVDDRINSSYFAKMANNILNEEDIVFQVDGSGWTGFFIQAHIVNGDGLVNSFDYASRLKRGDLAGYLDEIGAKYILVNKPSVDGHIVNIGGLKVSSTEVEKLLEVPLAADYWFAQFVLYKRIER